MGVFKRAFAFILTAAMLICASGCSKSRKAFSFSDVENTMISRNAVKFDDCTSFSRAVMSATDSNGDLVYMNCDGTDAQSIYNIIVNQSYILPACELESAFYMCRWQKDKSGDPADTTIYILTFKDGKTAEKMFSAIELQLIKSWSAGENVSGKKDYQYSTLIVEGNGSKYERGLYRCKNTLLFVKGLCTDYGDDEIVGEICDKLDVVTPMNAK